MAGQGRDISPTRLYPTSYDPPHRNVGFQAAGQPQAADGNGEKIFNNAIILKAVRRIEIFRKNNYVL